jgi:hypothetical protein
MHTQRRKNCHHLIAFFRTGDANHDRDASSAAVGTTSAALPLFIQLPTNPCVSCYRSFVPTADKDHRRILAPEAAA